MAFVLICSGPDPQRFGSESLSVSATDQVELMSDAKVPLWVKFHHFGVTAIGICLRKGDTREELNRLLENETLLLASEGSRFCGNRDIPTVANFDRSRIHSRVLPARNITDSGPSGLPARNITDSGPSATRSASRRETTSHAMGTGAVLSETCDSATAGIISYTHKFQAWFLKLKG
jgi:hypothetical protein